MIRFYCDQCGKSLRANENIIGKKIRCTACPAKMTVPEESTRKSGENRQHRTVAAQPAVEDKEILSVLVDSDSFESFEDFDFSSLQIDNKRNSFKLDESASPSIQLAKDSKAISPASQNTAQTANQFSSKSSKPVSKQVSFNLPSPSSFVPSSVSPKRMLLFLALLIGLIALIGIGYFGVQYFSTNDEATIRAEFENSATGKHYAQLLRDLLKAERVMFMLEEGYLTRKLPESDLTEVRELRKQAKEIGDNKSMLNEVYGLMRTGDEDGAKKVIREEKRRMTELTEQINKKNDWLTKKVYAR